MPRLCMLRSQRMSRRIATAQRERASGRNSREPFALTREAFLCTSPLFSPSTTRPEHASTCSLASQRHLVAQRFSLPQRTAPKRSHCSTRPSRDARREEYVEIRLNRDGLLAGIPDPEPLWRVAALARPRRATRATTASPVAIIRLTTKLGTDNRQACAADRRLRFPKYAPARRDSGVPKMAQ